MKKLSLEDIMKIYSPLFIENEPGVVIHWQNQDNHNVPSYYKGSDHLEKQDPKFANRTSPFNSKTQNGMPLYISED